MPVALNQLFPWFWVPAFGAIGLRAVPPGFSLPGMFLKFSQLLPTQGAGDPRGTGSLSMEKRAVRDEDFKPGAEQRW